MTEENISGLHKAAIFFMALGEDLASDVLRHLNDNEIKKVSSTLCELTGVSGEQVYNVLDEFSNDASSVQITFSGNMDYVENVIKKAVGGEKAESLLRQLVFTSSLQESVALKMSMDIEPKTLARLIGDEPPQVIALILSNMDEGVGSKALKGFPPPLQADVVARMAQIGEVPPEVMEDIQIAFSRKVKEIGSLARRKLDGMEIAVQLLNNLDRETGNAIMEKIETLDSSLAEEIKDRLFTFEDLAGLDDRTIQTILTNVNTQSLSVALKGCSQDLMNKIFNNLSDRAGEMLKEDMEVLGPIKRQEVHKVQMEIIGSVRKLEEEGKIDIGSGEEDVIV